MCLFSASIVKFTFTESIFYSFLNSWSYSDLVINYSGGFVRRGLIGQIFILLNNANVNHVVVSFLISLISMIHVIFFIIAKSINMSFINRIFIFFSPFGMIYLVLNVDTFFGRKELFILNFLIHLSKNNMNIKKAYLLSILLILVYELFIFFIPTVLFFIKNLYTKKSDILIYLATTIFLNLSMFTVFKDVRNFNELCLSINNLNARYSLNETDCWGAPRYLSNISYERWLRDVFYQYSNSNIFELLLIFILLITAIFLITNIKFDAFINQLKLVSPLFLLFFLGIDFGRWIFLIFTLSLIINFKNKQNYNTFKFSKLLFLFPLLSLFINIPIYLNQDVLVYELLILNQIYLIFYEFVSLIYLIRI